MLTYSAMRPWSAEGNHLDPRPRSLVGPQRRVPRPDGRTGSDVTAVEHIGHGVFLPGLPHPLDPVAALDTHGACLSGGSGLPHPSGNRDAGIPSHLRLLSRQRQQQQPWHPQTYRAKSLTFCGHRGKGGRDLRKPWGPASARAGGADGTWGRAPTCPKGWRTSWPAVAPAT